MLRIDGDMKGISLNKKHLVFFRFLSLQTKSIIYQRVFQKYVFPAESVITYSISGSILILGGIKKKIARLTTVAKGKNFLTMI